MANNLTTIEKSAIEYLCGLIRELSSVSEGIDDINLRSDGTFSSVKIDTLLNNLETNCNEYTDRLVANLSRLELKIVTDEADINKSNILYLHKPDGATSYNQYVVIEGNKVLLGTTDISMTDYYTITQADAKFALKTTIDTLTTEVTNIKTDFTTHKGDTVAHMTQTEKDNIVKKDDIVTTIDSTSTDDTVPSAKTIYKNSVRIKDLSFSYTGTLTTLEKVILTIINNTNPQNFETGVYSGRIISTHDGGGDLGTWYGNYILTVSHNNHYGTTGIVNTQGFSFNIQYTNGKWIIRKLCTTSVADIPVTDISMSSTYTNNPNCKYQVVNGICYVDFMSGTYKLTSNVNGVILATGLPRPRTGQVCTTYVPWSCADASKQVIIFVNGYGELILHASVNANATPMFCTFSYPVKES